MASTAVKTVRRVTKTLDGRLLANIIHNWTVSDFSLPDTSVINLIKNSPEHNRETFEAISKCQTRIDETIKSIFKLQKKYRVEITKTVEYGKEYDTVSVNIGNLHFSIDKTNYFYRDCCISIAKFYDYYQFNFNHLHFHNSDISEGNEGICLGSGGATIYKFAEFGRFDLAIKTIIHMLININLDSPAIELYEAENKEDDYYLGRYVHSGICPSCGKLALAKTGVIDLSDTEEYHVVYHKKCWQKLEREDD